MQENDISRVPLLSEQLTLKERQCQREVISAAEKHITPEA